MPLDAPLTPTETRHAAAIKAAHDLLSRWEAPLTAAGLIQIEHLAADLARQAGELRSAV
jgi:hypothetical protein